MHYFRHTKQLSLVLYPPHGFASTSLVSVGRCGLKWRIASAAPLIYQPHFNWTLFSRQKKSTFSRDVDLAMLIDQLTLNQTSHSCGSPPSSTLERSHQSCPIQFYESIFKLYWTDMTPPPQRGGKISKIGHVWFVMINFGPSWVYFSILGSAPQQTISTEKSGCRPQGKT